MLQLPLLEYVSSVFSHNKEIQRQIKEFCPNIILGFGILSVYLALRTAKSNGLPFIYYRIDADHRLLPYKAFQPIGKMIESKIHKQSDRTLVINEKLGDYAVKLGAPRQLTKLVRAGINSDKFDSTLSGDGVRKQYGIEKGDIVLFFMGWLYHFSGLKEVAQQLAATKEHNLKLLIVGEGDAYDELRQIQERHNLKDRLILTGRKSYQEIPACIAAADICLLPAYPAEEIMQDIVPIKMYEYMAMKKPVIATRLPGVMKEFGNDNGVIYVEKPEDAIDKAIDVIRNGNANELGLKARSFVERNSWEKITDEFERILEEAIKEKRNE